MEWKDSGMRLDAKGSKGSSSSSSPARTEERKDELGVLARGRSDWSGIKGAAIARLEVALRGLWAHRSGDGVSALRADRELGLEDAAERGRGIGLNSDALAFRRRGEDNGEAGRLAVN
jgi:hypothetical protein